MINRLLYQNPAVIAQYRLNRKHKEALSEAKTIIESNHSYLKNLNHKFDLAIRN